MVSKVTDCKPVGQLVLVEHLTDNEMLGTSLHLPESTAGTAEVQQSIVLAVGPRFSTENWGFDVGDRVMVIGSYNPVPKYGAEDREKGIIEPHTVRAVLVQGSDLITEQLELKNGLL